MNTGRQTHPEFQSRKLDDKNTDLKETMGGGIFCVAHIV